MHTAATSAPTDPASNPEVAVAARRGVRATPARGPVGSLVETTKPGITRLVTITSMVGFAASATERVWSWPQLLYVGGLCLVGTALSAAGANSINQWMERDRDAVMPRTAHRPLPTGRSTPRAVLLLGVVLSVAGVLALLPLGWAPAAISLACVVSYVVFYTPLKTRTTLSTFVGAIPGGLPPLIGWTAGSAATGWEAIRDPLGLSLAGLMLIWQIPHFLAIAWMYRDDYATGGFRVLPVLDPDGKWTSLAIGLWAGTLIPATLMPAIIAPERLGATYAAVALVTGMIYALLAARFVMTRERRHARQVFFASIMHLPLLLFTLTGEVVIRAFTR